MNEFPTQMDVSTTWNGLSTRYHVWKTTMSIYFTFSGGHFFILHSGRQQQLRWTWNLWYFDFDWVKESNALYVLAPLRIGRFLFMKRRKLILFTKCSASQQKYWQMTLYLLARTSCSCWPRFHEDVESRRDANKSRHEVMVTSRVTVSDSIVRSVRLLFHTMVTRMVFLYQLKYWRLQENY